MTNKTTEPAALAGIEQVAIEYCGRCDKATLPYDFNTTFYSAATVERLMQERDEWKARASRTYMAKDLRQQLAASQAREQQLRDVVEDVVHSRQGCISRAVAALSLPQDDTALNQWGAKLLRELVYNRLEGLCNESGMNELLRKADELETGK